MVSDSRYKKHLNHKWMLTLHNKTDTCGFHQVQSQTLGRVNIPEAESGGQISLKLLFLFMQHKWILGVHDIAKKIIN